jgi:Zn-dependent protease with chaperone function
MSKDARAVRRVFLLAGSTVAWLLGGAASALAQSDAELAFDAAIEERARERSPEAARLWHAATEAGYRHDLKTARLLYKQLIRAQPGFKPAFRALAGVELELGNRDKALEAVAIAALGSEPLDLAAYALVLARSGPGGAPSAADVANGFTLAQRAAANAPDELYVQLSLCEVAVLAGELDTAQRVAEQLYATGPRTPEIPLCYARVLDARGDAARAAEERANARSLYEAELAQRRATAAALAETPDEPALPPKPRQPLTLGALVRDTLFLWLAGLVVLLAAGMSLSRSVLRTADDLARRARAASPSAGAALRRSYAVVLWLSCAYYYLSLPLLALVTLALGGGILYAMFAVGRVPIKLALIVAALTLATLWSILKSLFVRGQDEDPGERLELSAHPRLRALLDDVAARIGTRAVDSVYLTPGTELAVMERGGFGRRLRGGSERCLILGVGVLNGLRIGPLKAVLAHEYGHFSNRDTAGGGFALAVRRSLLTMAMGLAESGAAAWYNPVWLFLNGFHRVFLRISQGASRLQEILADRTAVLTYGSKAFEEGLRHVIERSVRFGAGASQVVARMAMRQAVANLYAHAAEPAAPDAEVEKAVREVLNRRPSPYDSHPSPTERSRWARALNAKGSAAAPEDAEEAWSLFTNRQAIEERMTEAVRRAVLSQAAG